MTVSSEDHQIHPEVVRLLSYLFVDPETLIKLY